jgi:hypothetical protein
MVERIPNATEAERSIDSRRQKIAMAITCLGLGATLTTGAVTAGAYIGTGSVPPIVKDMASAVGINKESGASIGDHPLGKPPVPPAGQGGYKFLDTQPNDRNQPVRWDPCEPIEYVINPAGAPAGGAEAINRAVKTISDTTGLQFVYDGPTTENAVKNRPTFNESLYGKSPSPVLVDWVTPAEYPDMLGLAGLGGPDTVDTSSDMRKDVSGVVVLNRDYLSGTTTQGHNQQLEDTTVLHEFGHLVGLDHADDPSSLMFHAPAENTLDDGTRRGLAELGSGDCL